MRVAWVRTPLVQETPTRVSTRFRRFLCVSSRDPPFLCESVSMSVPLLFGFGFAGHWEILIIGAIILLLFGHRLPSLMRSLGRGVVEFKKGVHGIDDDVEPASIDGEGKRSTDE